MAWAANRTGKRGRQPDGLKDGGTVGIVARKAAPAITADAERNGYTHIVIGTGDKHGLMRLVLGSVVAAVVALAHCTVTVAR